MDTAKEFDSTIKRIRMDVVMTGTIYMMLGGILSIASISIYVYLYIVFKSEKKD